MPTPTAASRCPASAGLFCFARQQKATAGLPEAAAPPSFIAAAAFPAFVAPCASRCRSLLSRSSARIVQTDATRDGCRCGAHAERDTVSAKKRGGLLAGSTHHTTSHRPVFPPSCRWARAARRASEQRQRQSAAVRPVFTPPENRLRPPDPDARYFSAVGARQPNRPRYFAALMSDAATSCFSLPLLLFFDSADFADIFTSSRLPRPLRRVVRFFT